MSYPVFWCGGENIFTIYCPNLNLGTSDCGSHSTCFTILSRYSNLYIYIWWCSFFQVAFSFLHFTWRNLSSHHDFFCSLHFFYYSCVSILLFPSFPYTHTHTLTSSVVQRYNQLLYTHIHIQFYFSFINTPSMNTLLSLTQPHTHVLYRGSLTILIMFYPNLGLSLINFPPFWRPLHPWISLCVCCNNTFTST